MNKYILAIVAIFSCSSVATFAQDTNDYFSATQELEQLIRTDAQKRTMPRLENSRVAELISILSDSHRFLDSKKYHVKDIEELIEICGGANNAVMAYSLFDLRNRIDPEAPPPLNALQVQKLMGENIATFQDELKQLQPFVIKCLAKEASLLPELIESLKPEALTDVRLSGLQQFRAGILGSYYGFIQIAGNSALTESYRARVIQALAETAPQLSKVFQPEARRQIIDLIDYINAQPTTPEAFHHYLKVISDAMNKATCIALCDF